MNDSDIIDEDVVQVSLPDSIPPNEEELPAIPMDAPTASEQAAIIEVLMRDPPLEEGQTWYVVSMHWYKAWEEFCRGKADPPAEINNLTILDGPRLRMNLSEGTSYTLLCQEAADKIYIYT